MVSFQFHKNFSGPSFCDGWTKNLQTFSKQFFLERPSTYCIVEFTAIFMFCLLRWSKRYQWNKVATSLARDFNNSWPLYLNFSNMINLWPNIWFMKNSKCHQFLFWKRRRQKTKFLNILKGRHFVMDGPIDMNVGEFWETSGSFLKNVVLELFPKYSQSYVNLDVKSSAKHNCL